jgi:hypothetical protein
MLIPDAVENAIHRRLMMKSGGTLIETLLGVGNALPSGYRSVKPREAVMPVDRVARVASPA